MSEKAVIEGFKRFARYHEPHWKFHAQRRERCIEYQLTTALIGVRTRLTFSFVTKRGKPIVFTQFMVSEQTPVQSDTLTALYTASRWLCKQYEVRLSQQRFSDGQRYLRIEHSLPDRFWEHPFEFHSIMQSLLEYHERFMPMYYSIWALPNQGKQIRHWANPSSRLVH